MRRSYYGRFTHWSRTVRVIDHETGCEYDLPHVPWHSPDGFGWGYGGSGPTELARCILLDYLGEDPPAALYQSFKAEHVAQWPQDADWRIESDTIGRWIATRAQEVG